MLKHYTAALLILTSLNAFSQKFKVTGKVTNGILYVEDVSVLNSRTKMKSHTDKKGEFMIEAIKGDSLVFAKDGFSNVLKIIDSQAFLSISLKYGTNYLKEVIIRSVRSSPLKKYEFNRNEYKSIYQKGDKSNMVTITPVGIGVNITALYSALSREGINARRLQKIITKDYEDRQVDMRYNSYLVNSITGLTGTELETFTNTYRPSLDWTSDASDYDIILYIKNKFLLWKAEYSTN